MKKLLLASTALGCAHLKAPDTGLNHAGMTGGTDPAHSVKNTNTVADAHGLGAEIDNALHLGDAGIADVTGAQTS